MILRSLTVENFRPFYGQQTVAFSTREDRNVTVLYGPNGGGKTALLNAFTWALYKTTTPGFEQPDDLINHRAWAEGADGAEVSARVIVTFEHENQVFTVERNTTDRKGQDGRALRVRDAAVAVKFIDEGGRDYNRDDTAEGTINQILPERLHRFFFFDGERIEHLVKPAAYAEIEDAIKTVLGLEVIERGIRHLDDARKTLEKELSDVGSDEDKRIAADLERARDEREHKKEGRETTRRNRAARQTDIEDIDRRLAQLEEARELQHQREQLEADQAEAESNIASSRRSLATAISERGYLAFIATLLDRTVDVFDKRREHGEIPADIKLQFVEDLLDRSECICGNPLHEGEAPYVKVAEWRQRAGRPDVEAAWNRLPANARHFADQRGTFYRYLDETNKELAGFRDSKRRVEDKLSAIKDSIEDLDSDEVKGLEHRRDVLKREIDDDSLAIRIADQNVDSLDKRIQGLVRDLEAAEAQNQKAEIARRRVIVAREARDIFATILRLRTEEVRSQIDTRIKQIYSHISFKAYTPSLDHGFRLELKTKLGDSDTAVAKSTGENQILSLAFVGAVAEHARERYNESAGDGRSDSMLSFQGGIYPVVMDSPFGSLDENYQGQIAEAIPTLAPQVIIFVSKSQGLNAVQDVLGPRIDQEYVIQFYTPKEGQERETITLRDGKHPYIEPADSEFEWAELKEV